jgi:hypothetical protein
LSLFFREFTPARPNKKEARATSRPRQGANVRDPRSQKDWLKTSTGSYIRLTAYTGLTMVLTFM